MFLRMGIQKDEIYYPTIFFLKAELHPVSYTVMPLVGGQGRSSVNPITTRGADYAQRITDSPPGFENLAAALNYVPTKRL